MVVAAGVFDVHPESMGTVMLGCGSDEAAVSVFLDLDGD